MDYIFVSTLSFPDTEEPIRLTTTFNNHVNKLVRGCITEIQDSHTLTVQLCNDIKGESCQFVTEYSYASNNRLHKISKCDMYSQNNFHLYSSSCKMEDNAHNFKRHIDWTNLRVGSKRIQDKNKLWFSLCKEIYIFLIKRNDQIKKR